MSAGAPSPEEFAASFTDDICKLVVGDGAGAILIIKAYLDESGIQDRAPVTSVAAYLSTPEKWKIFTRKWVGVLKRAGLTSFHMNDYAQRHRAFEGWNSEDQRKLGENLFPLIPRYTKFGISVAMVKADFDEVFKDYPAIREGLGRPYTCCFQWLIQCVLADRRLLSPGSQLACIHEDNDYKREAIEAWDYLKSEKDLGRRLKSLTFAAKSDFVPLQAADVLAWESQKALADPNRPERKSLAVLRSSGKLTIQTMRPQWLKENAPRLDAAAREYLRQKHERQIEK